MAQASIEQENTLWTQRPFSIIAMAASIAIGFRCFDQNGFLNTWLVISEVNAPLQEAVGLWTQMRGISLLDVEFVYAETGLLADMTSTPASLWYTDPADPLIINVYNREPTLQGPAPHSFDDTVASSMDVSPCSSVTESWPRRDADADSIESIESSDGDLLVAADVMGRIMQAWRQRVNAARPSQGPAKAQPEPSHGPAIARPRPWRSQGLLGVRRHH